jgi:hypothetical protein
MKYCVICVGLKKEQTAMFLFTYDLDFKPDTSVLEQEPALFDDMEEAERHRKRMEEFNPDGIYALGYITLCH